MSGRRATPATARPAAERAVGLEAFRAVRVLSSARRGSTWPLLVATTGPTVLAKLRGAGPGETALVAEVVVGHLAERLGLRVPRRVLVTIDTGLESESRDPELLHLLQASRGLNLGFEALAGVRDFRPGSDRVSAEEACAIVWLDWLVMNPDRTSRSPNLMVDRNGLWLIDHGSALVFHHDWGAVTEASPSAPWRGFSSHVLRGHATDFEEWAGMFRDTVGREDLREALRQVPVEWLEALLGGAGAGVERRREAYVAFLWKRLRSPPPAFDG